MPGGKRIRRSVKRGLEWSRSTEKATLTEIKADRIPKAEIIKLTDNEVGIEKGSYALIGTERADTGQLRILARSLDSLFLTAVVRRASAWMERLEVNLVYAYIKPAADLLVRLRLTFLSLLVRLLLARLGAILLFVLLTVLFGLLGLAKE